MPLKGIDEGELRIESRRAFFLTLVESTRALRITASVV